MTYDEALEKLKPHVDFSNFPADHPRYCSDRKAALGFVKVDTADNIIHAILAEKKKSYHLFTDKSVSQVANAIKLSRKDTLKGVKKAAVHQMTNKQILELKGKPPGIIKVNFKKLQAKRHKITMIKQTKTASNSFDDSAFYRNCDLCNIPFNCTLPNAEICTSLDCKLNKLLIDIWARLEEVEEQVSR